MYQQTEPAQAGVTDVAGQQRQLTAEEMADNVREQLNRCNTERLRLADELSIKTHVAQGNQRHVAILTAMLDRVEQLADLWDTAAGDGAEVRRAAAVELRRALNERIPGIERAPDSSRPAQDEPRPGGPRFVPYAERAPLYAAYRAARAEADRIGGVLSDDSIIQAGVKAYEAERRAQQPKIVTICGSTRFRAEIADANRRLTLAGHMVLAPGVFGHDGDEITEEQKEALDDLHFRKIDLADEVYVVNPGGYLGESTLLEMSYARRNGKPISRLVEQRDVEAGAPSG